MRFFVSRQCYWGVDPSEANTVEIATGGCDYANPDMLVEKYPGEGVTYTDPREAIQAAFEIAQAWKRDCPKLKINIAHGFTAGMTMPFEGSTKKEIKAWADKVYQGLPKCAECGDILGDEKYGLEDFPDEKFCREYCAEEFLRENSVMEEEVS